MSLLRLFKLFGSDSSKYANVLEANTARTTGTIVVATQNIDQTGKVPPAGDAVGNAPFVKLTDGTNTAAIDAANTARTTGTKVQAVQIVDSTGKVPPAGDSIVNAPYSNIIHPKAIPVKITLVAGVDNHVKASSGYVFAITTSLTDLYVKNNSVDVWQNEYWANSPFYCDTDITLNSVTGGVAFVVYL
jgi:hypothetical protein